MAIHTNIKQFEDRCSKILATLAPLSSSSAVIRRLIEVGVNVFV